MSKHVIVVEGLITAKADVCNLVKVDFIPYVIAEHLSMRHVMLWLWQALIGSWFEGCACMYVSVGVCNGLTVEVYDFYVTFNMLTQVPCVFFATKTTRQLTYCMAEKIDKRTRDSYT